MVLVVALFSLVGFKRSLSLLEIPIFFPGVLTKWKGLCTQQQSCRMLNDPRRKEVGHLFGGVRKVDPFNCRQGNPESGSFPFSHLVP